jgi:hypothetical protein
VSNWDKSLFASFSSEKEESLFFSEEKNQKTFYSCLADLGAGLDWVEVWIYIILGVYPRVRHAGRKMGQ